MSVSSLNENDGCCKEKPSVCKFSSCCEHITVFPKKQEKFGAQTIQEITEVKMLSQLNGERAFVLGLNILDLLDIISNSKANGTCVASESAVQNFSY